MVLSAESCVMCYAVHFLAGKGAVRGYNRWLYAIAITTPPVPIHYTLANTLAKLCYITLPRMLTDVKSILAQSQQETSLWGGLWDNLIFLPSSRCHPLYFDLIFPFIFPLVLQLTKGTLAKLFSPEQYC